jgi:hypothetical protein
MHRMLADRIWTEPKPEFLTSFDDLDVATTRLIRHHVFVARLSDESPALRLDAGARWVERERLDGPARFSTSLVRALACARARP